MSDQKYRLITIDTPLGPDFFTVESFHGEEAISTLFRFDIELRAKTLDVAFSKMIDQPVTLTLYLSDGSKRFFNGIVADFTQTLGSASADFTGSFSYKCTVVPSIWSMTQTSDLRIFVDTTIPDIIEEFFENYGFSDFDIKITKEHPELPLCTQFQESDFAFLSRIMERAGIFYFFKHEKKSHKMVLTDTNSIIKFFQDDKKAKFKATDTDWHTNDRILDLYWREKVRSRLMTLRDYNSEMPNAELMSSADTKSDLGNTPREHFEYPGDFTSHKDADNLSKLRMEEQEAKLTKIHGKSTYRTMQAGSKFILEDYFREDRNNKSYLLTSVTHSVTKDPTSKGEANGLQYWNDFSCIPTENPFRPPRKTKKPKVYGVQIAKVTSDPDEYGRVDIQITWDRNKETIPKVPVSQIMAGANWGTMFVPHIDHEVVVDFIGGDPDRPIIVGRLYNGDNMPQYELPAEKTKSVIYSEGENEIVIEDKDGDKYIRIEQACGNEIELHENSPTITIQQECGNQIILDCDSPNIEIKQRNGNFIKLDDTTQNITLSCPVGASVIEMGNTSKGIQGISQHTSGSTWEEKFGNSKTMTIGRIEEFAMSMKATQTIGLESQIFVGGKHSTFIGAEVKFNAAKEISLNSGGDVEQKTKHEHRIIALKGISFKGGTAAQSKGRFDSGKILFESGQSQLEIKKDNDVTLKSKKDLHLKGTGGKTKITANKEIQLNASKITLKGNNFTFNGSKVKIG